MAGTIVRVVEKALDILSLLQNETAGLPLKTLAERTGENPNTLRSILNTLIKKGYVSQPESRGVYLTAHHNRPEIKYDQERILAVLDDISYKLNGAMVFASRVDGLRLSGIARFGNIHAAWFNSGEELEQSKLHALAQGKIVLAHLSAYELAHFLELNRLETFTRTTEVNAERLKEQLATVKQENFAATKDEFETGISSFAAGIRRENGILAATVAVRVPSLVADKTFQTYAHDVLHESLTELKKIFGK